MHAFWRVYGRTGLGLIAMALLSVGLAVFLGNGFGQYGPVPDKSIMIREDAIQKTSVSGNKPVLYAKSIRVIQGEKKLIASLASAQDVDGKSLDDSIRFLDKEGHELRGAIDTSSPGCFPVTVSVCSKITGQKTKQKINILVDGRVSAWKE